ncbi:MAG: sulfotransferase family 2 domain-containing protein [Cyanobacteria bacterium J06560_6]
MDLSLLTKPEKNREPLIVFTHIVKTAGSTLHFLISRQYNNNQVYRVYDNFRERFPTMLKDLEDENNTAEESEKKVLCTHLGFGLHQFLPRPSIYITMLREPIDRVISSYYYGAKRHEHIRKLTLKEFVIEECDRSYNLQTRLLSGLRIQDQLAGHKVTPDEVIDLAVSSNKILEDAKNNLRNSYEVVGLTERFDESLLLFQKRFGWKNVHYVKANVNKSRPRVQDISADTLKLIEEYNSLDLELYEYAQKIMNDQIQLSLPSIDKDLKKFRRRNKLYSLAHPYLKPVVTSFRSLSVANS